MNFTGHAAVALALMVPPVAWAADPGEPAVLAGPIFELLPTGAVIGDGRTVATLQLLAIGPDGRPMVGLRAKVSASAGVVGPLRHVGGAVYELDLTPPAVTSVEPIRVEVSARTPDRDRVVVARDVDVRPPAGGGIQVVANPAELVAGPGGEATLSFTVTDARGRPVQGAEPIVLVSAGRVENLTPLGGGRFTARYSTPDASYPQLALVTVADRRDPSAIRGAAVLPLLGKVDYPVEAPPGSSVILRVAGREFGPVVAPDGSAERVSVSVPLVVPPGVTQGTLVTVLAGQATEAPLDLRTPDARRIQMFPVHPSIPAEPSVGVPVRVLVRTPAGGPDDAASVSITSTAGEVGPAVHEGGGVYRAVWHPSGVDAAIDATLVAALPGSDRQSAALDVHLVPVSASIGDASAADNALRHVLVVADADRVANDGVSERTLTVLTVDAFGLGVPGVEVALSAEGVVVPERVTTDAAGVARMTLRAGVEPRLVRVRAEAGGRAGEAAFLQVPAGVVPVELPVAGDPDRVAIERRWRALVRGTALPAAAPAARAPAATGPRIESLVVRVEPERVAPGGTVMIHAHAAASDGSPVSGQALELMASAGTFGRVSDLGEGDYLVGLTIPEGAVDLVRITVASPDGEASSFLKVPVVAGPVASAAAAAPEAPVAVPEAPVAAPIGEDRPRPDGDEPGIRVRAGWAVSSYRYEQRPGHDGGPLVPEIVSIGGALGEGPAHPQGVEVAVVGVVPGLPYLGFSVLGRTSGFGVRSSGFGGVSRQLLTHVEADAIGRYPLEVAGGTVHAGLRVGFRYNDLAYYAGSIDDGAIAVEALVVPGLGLGAEIGARFQGTSALLSIHEDFSGLSAPFATTVDLRVAQALTERLSLELGFVGVTRRAELVGDHGETWGELSDGQIIGVAGLGWRL